LLLKEVKKNTLFKSRTAHDHPGLWVMEKARSLLNDGVGVALAVAEGDLDGVEAGRKVGVVAVWGVHVGQVNKAAAGVGHLDVDRAEVLGEDHRERMAVDCGVDRSCF